MSAPRRLDLTELGTREFSVLNAGRCYRMSVPDYRLVLEVDRLTWHHQELGCELLVRCEMAGTDAINGVLSLATFNVSSARARTDRATLLGKQAKSPELPWHPLLEDFCQRVLIAERTGEPAVVLRDVERPEASDRLLSVFGFQLPKQHPSILFGDGGSAKSYLALYLAGRLALDGYRVALFDWELDAGDHRDRYERLFGTDMPAQLLYSRCARPLIHEVDRLTRIARLEGLDFLVFDSIGFACHEAPESADAALQYFRAVRQIGLGSLHVAHINKSEQGDQKPFGSAFFHNSARATWFIKPTTDIGSTLTLGIWPRKQNLTGRRAPFGMTAAFTASQTVFTLTDIATIDEFAAQVPLAQRLRLALKGGAKTREEVRAAFPDEKPDTLKRVINRGLERGDLIKFPGVEDDRIGIRAS